MISLLNGIHKAVVYRLGMFRSPSCCMPHFQSTGFNQTVLIVPRSLVRERHFHLGVSCTVFVLTCFVMCGCFGNMYTCIYCVLFLLCCVLCIVSFMYIYCYLFCLHWCKDYCHRVTTQLQLVVVVVL